MKDKLKEKEEKLNARLEKKKVPKRKLHIENPKNKWNIVKVCILKILVSEDFLRVNFQKHKFIQKRNQGSNSSSCDEDVPYKDESECEEYTISDSSDRIPSVYLQEILS